MVGSTTNRISYEVTSASTSPLTVNYRFDDPAWLQLRYVETGASESQLLVSGTDYTVSGDGVVIEGEVTLTADFLASITSGDLVIARFAPALQELDLQFNTRFPSALTEKQLDWIVMSLQDRTDSGFQAGSRAIYLPPNEPTANTNTLQVWTERAGKLQYFNADTGAITTISIEDLAPLILAYYDGIITAEDVLAAISAIAPLERFTPPTTSTLGKFGQLAIIPEHVDLEITGTLSPDITGTLLPWKTQNGKIWFSTYGEDPETLTGDAISVLISWTGAWVISVYEYGVVNVSTRWASFPGSWLSDPYPNNVGSWINIGTTGQPGIDTINEEAARFWVNLAPTDTTPNWQEVNGNSGILTPEMFGAVGDGTTDDTEAIQAAINAAGVQGGGTISFGPRTYRVSENGSTGYCLICSYPKVVLRGQGASTRIACNTADVDTILFAEGVGPYDSGTEPIDHCGVFDMYFNPLVQKTDASFEIRVPFTCRFSMRGIHFGRLDSMISGTTPVLESKIGSFFALGDELTRGCIDSHISDIRGFGYYQAIRLSRVFDTIISGWTSDANNSTADSVYIVGACESNFFSSCGFVNSGGLFDASTGNCIQLLTGTSGTPSLNNFTDCFFDTHGRGLLANGGFSNVFQGCWFGSGQYEGAYVHEDATAYQFIGCRFNATKTEGIAFDSGVNHVLDSCETYSNNRSGSGSPNKGAVRIGTGVSGVRITNHSQDDNLFIPRYSQGFCGTGLLVEAGAGTPILEGNRFSSGTTILSDLASQIPMTNLLFWGNPQASQFYADGEPVTRLSNSIGSGSLGFKNYSSTTLPYFRKHGAAGMPVFEFNRANDNDAMSRLHNFQNASDSTIELTGDFTVIAVQKTTGDCIVFGAGFPSDSDNFQLRVGAPTDSMSLYNSSTYNATDTFTADRDAWMVLGWRRSGTALSFWENGVKLGSNVTMTTATHKINRLGGTQSLTDQLISGFLGDFLIFNAALSDADILLISNNLRNKYAGVLAL